MATKPRIHLHKGDTLVTYTIERSPKHGIELTYTIHPQLQLWMQRLSEETVQLAGGVKPTLPLSETASASGITEHGIVPADRKGEDMWRVHMNTSVRAHDRPNLRLDSTPRRNLTGLAWLRLCVNHLKRRVQFPLLTDYTFWEKQWDEVADTYQFAVTREIDTALRNLRLTHVVLDTPKATVTHTIR